MNIGNVTAPASIAAPIANKHPPITIALVLPILSDTAPLNSEASVVVKSTDETTRPCIVEVRGPKVVEKEVMAVMGPMVPVSRLGGC
jgi:hypothetical protein